MPGPTELIEIYVTAETLDTETDGWMEEIAPYQWRGTKPFDVASSALLVVDMNNIFVESGPLSTPNARAIVPRIAGMVDAFRAAERPVLWSIQGHHSVAHDRGEHLSSWWPTPILEGTSDVALPAALTPRPDEKVIMKRRYSAFYQTDLELTLRCLQVKQLVICGVLTNVCPLTSAFDAFFRDFDVYYPADGTAAFNRELHVGALRSIAGWCGYVVRASEICNWLTADHAEAVR
ncbi:MAG: isochorismatase family protein [Armatimonadota bacterium]